MLTDSLHTRARASAPHRLPISNSKSGARVRPAQRRHAIPDRLRAGEGNTGFTLIELLAVMAIMILMLALVAPSVSTIVRGKALNRAAADVAGVLDFARTEAMSKNTYVFVGFANVPAPPTKPFYWQLLIGVKRSVDGTLGTSATPINLDQNDPNQPSSVRWVGNLQRYDNIALVGDTAPAKLTQAVLDKVPSTPTPTYVTSSKCTPTAKTFQFTIPGSTSSNAKFQQIIMFTPQGEVIAGKQLTNTSVANPTTIPYEGQLVVGLRRTISLGPSSTATTVPQEAFTDNDPDSAAILIHGGTGELRTLRP
jgi:prepilin-type N-terminal cleavage/methylation domain-containing protein